MSRWLYSDFHLDAAKRNPISKWRHHLHIVLQQQPFPSSNFILIFLSSCHHGISFWPHAKKKKTSLTAMHKNRFTLQSVGLLALHVRHCTNWEKTQKVSLGRRLCKKALPQWEFQYPVFQCDHTCQTQRANFSICSPVSGHWRQM